MCMTAFEAVLFGVARNLAREAGAGARRTIVLVSTTRAGMAKRGSMSQTACGWFPAAYTPELQPAETLWALVDEPIVNKQSRPSTNLTTSSAKDAPPSPTNETPSKAEPASTGGRKSQARSDHPETVSPVQSRDLIPALKELPSTLPASRQGEQTMRKSCTFGRSGHWNRERTRNRFDDHACSTSPGEKPH